MNKKYIKTSLVASIIVVGSVLSGCASMFGDNTRDVKVDSSPQGAAIWIDNHQYGVTPAVVTLSSYIYSGKIVTLKLQGYSDQSKTINSQFQPVGLFNILFWPGFLIDAATGNSVKVSPSDLNMFISMNQISGS